MYSHDAPDVLWVSSAAEEKGKGTYNSPFGSVQDAAERARPGDTIVLANGMYTGDVTIQTSGTIGKPIRIAGESKEQVILSRSCWYFYDVTDLIVSDLTFRDAPSGAIFVMGQSQRNAFSRMNFVNCSTAADAACTFFFGGAGGRDNIVEDCAFIGAPRKSEASSGEMALPIGLMISEGDDEEMSEPNRDHVFRGNVLVNYGSGILAGSRGVETSLYGHVIERNTIRDCRGDGIRVRCGDTAIVSNKIERCGGAGVVLLASNSSTIELNRIEDCATGIRASGDGHTLSNNCILNSREQAFHIPVAEDPEHSASENIIIENNSCITTSQADNAAMQQRAGFRLARESTCIVRRNIVFGPGEALVTEKRPEAGAIPVSSFVEDNLATGGCEAGEGFRSEEVRFRAMDAGDFATDSDYGAQGWSARGGEMESEGSPDEEMVLHTSDPEAINQLMANLNRRQLLPREMFGIDEDLELNAEPREPGLEDEEEASWEEEE